ncbi:extracellular solute-binding protein [Butyrivibrio sp. X503]|uniref:ABC transporter substrate-binding protein n=1 Tax=Butyrivibrio sp. X503 TaxID=2364878 RepID=UPI000EA96F49|nr:extracellular solute-binding protein [Butyrivibrio sp. X503]RKM57056.1 extracellular solute-binding protein [Butyrivibrio sp. X503]
MKGIFKRGLSLIFTTTMIMSVLTGCGKGKADGDASKGNAPKDENILQEASVQKKDYVYKSEELQIEGVDIGSNFVSDLKPVGDGLCFYESVTDGPEKIVSITKEGKYVGEYELPAENYDFYKHINYLSDGGCIACLYKKEQESSDPKISIVHVDPSGNIIESHELTDDESSIFLDIAVLSDGRMFTVSVDGLYSFSFEEGFKKIIEAGKNGGENLCSSSYFIKGSNDQIFVFSNAEETTLQKLDVDNQTLLEKSAAYTSDYAYNSNAFLGEGKDFYLSTDEGFFGYDAQKDEIVKLLDYNDSDIDATYFIEAAYAISPDEFIAIYNGSSGETKVERFTKVPADQVKDRKVLTLASTACDNSLNIAVTEFNKTHDDYKINLVEYCKMTDDDWIEGMKKLDMDIISDNVPDIMVFGQQEIDKYKNKGLFLDLKPYYDRDKVKDNIELIPNVENALTKDGKMYNMITDFTVLTMIAKTKFTGGKDVLSIKDYEKIIEDNNTPYELAFGLQTNMDVLGNGIVNAADKYIDTKNKKCNFDSESFIELLEFANKFPSEINYNKYSGDVESYYRSDQALFSNYGLSGFCYFRGIKQAVFGDEVSFIGFPNDEGVNQSIIYPSSNIAISSRTENADAAWEFVKSLMKKNDENDYMNSFPTNKKAFEEAAKKSMEEPIDEYTGEKETWKIDDVTTELKPFTQQEVDEIKNFILSINNIYEARGQEMSEIIVEEASAYFAGQKSAEEVAKIIQSRMTILVSENS